MWPKLDDEFLKAFPRQSGDSVLPPECKTEAEAWKLCLDTILDIRELEDDWDGQGTEAPTPEVVDSAMILAVMLRQRGVRPPSWTVQGVCGDVSFEWQWWNLKTLHLDVTEPYEADLVILTPGEKGQHLTLRQAVAV